MKTLSVIYVVLAVVTFLATMNKVRLGDASTPSPMEQSAALSQISPGRI